MGTVVIYVLVSAVVLAVLIACLVFFVNVQKSESRLTRLAGLAVAFVLAGLLFGSYTLAGYSLVGAGVMLAITNMFLRARAA